MRSPRTGRVGRVVVALVALFAASLPLGIPGDRAAAGGIVYESIEINTPGPLGAVAVVGDSVLVGAGLYSPTLPDQLAARGYGPIKFMAVGGMSSGYFDVPYGAKATYWLSTWKAQGFRPRTVIVNLGSNDSGLCRGSYECSYRSITHVLDTIGSGPQVWIPLATHEPDKQYLVNGWNRAVRQVAAERGYVHAWDWPAVMAAGNFPSADNIHLSPDGYRRRSVLMADAVTAATAKARRTGGDAPLPAPTASASRYVAISPQRITDTREDAPGRRPRGSTLRVDFGSIIPEDATAVAISTTAARPSTNGYLRALPCGGSSAASTVNYTRGVSRGAMTITPLGSGGDICIYTHGQTDIVVDLQGAFVPATSPTASAGFVPRSSPERLHDTRKTGRTPMLVLPMPPTASAVAVSLAAVNGARAGWVRAFPCGASTEVSNINFRAGEAVAGSAFVPTSADGTICVTSNQPVDIVVDLTGVFTDDGGLSFRPVSPTRMVDTRDGTGGWSPIMGAGQTIDFRVAPSGARAVTGTVALIDPHHAGFVTGFGCGTRPPTSSVNASPGLVLANSVTTGVSSTGRLCLFSQRTSQLIFDTTGWWVS